MEIAGGKGAVADALKTKLIDFAQKNGDPQGWLPDIASKEQTEAAMAAEQSDQLGGGQLEMRPLPEPNRAVEKTALLGPQPNGKAASQFSSIPMPTARPVGKGSSKGPLSGLFQYACDN